MRDEVLSETESTGTPSCWTPVGALPMGFQRMLAQNICLVGFMDVRVQPSLSAHSVPSELRWPVRSGPGSFP